MARPTGIGPGGRRLALDAVTGTGQERFTGWLFCLGARALADLAGQARGPSSPAAKGPAFTVTAGY